MAEKTVAMPQLKSKPSKKKPPPPVKPEQPPPVVAPVVRPEPTIPQAPDPIPPTGGKGGRYVQPPPPDLSKLIPERPPKTGPPGGTVQPPEPGTGGKNARYKQPPPPDLSKFIPNPSPQQGTQVQQGGNTDPSGLNREAQNDTQQSSAYEQSYSIPDAEEGHDEDVYPRLDFAESLFQLQKRRMEKAKRRQRS